MHQTCFDYQAVISCVYGLVDHRKDCLIFVYVSLRLINSTIFLGYQDARYTWTDISRFICHVFVKELEPGQARRNYLKMLIEASKIQYCS